MKRDISQLRDYLFKTDFFFKIENSRKLELEKFQNHKFAKIEARENYQIYSMMNIHV